MADDTTTTVSVSMNSALAPAAAFDTVVDEVVSALDRAGLAFAPGPEGRITQGDFGVGRVTEWVPGERMRLQWHQADWEPETLTAVELRVEPSGAGAQITLAHRGWGALIGGPAELVGWFASAVGAPFLASTAPAVLGDWLTDRSARRPTGAQSRAMYGDPLYHWPNFRVFLAEIDLSPGDNLLEVGCGGGALLREMLKSGCHAAAIDHGFDMVRLARATNQDAIAAGRLTIAQGDAEHLPFPDATFTRAIMTGVLAHLSDPVGALREIRRVLAEGGRLMVLGSDPELRGTPAAPEPAASRLRFYTPDELRDLGIAAGFANARVERRDLEQYAREAGVPEEHLDLFRGPGATFLFASKE
jgi:ubiquinone/menaquinone biosynthesis C-methylase UbiE